MLVVASEVVGRLGSARVSVDALVVHIEPTRGVVAPLLRLVCHGAVFTDFGRVVKP